MDLIKKIVSKKNLKSKKQQKRRKGKSIKKTIINKGLVNIIEQAKQDNVPINKLIDFLIETLKPKPRKPRGPRKKKDETEEDYMKGIKKEAPPSEQKKDEKKGALASVERQAPFMPAPNYYAGLITQPPPQEKKEKKETKKEEKKEESEKLLLNQMELAKQHTLFKFLNQMELAKQQELSMVLGKIYGEGISTKSSKTKPSVSSEFKIEEYPTEETKKKKTKTKTLPSTVKTEEKNIYGLVPSGYFDNDYLDSSRSSIKSEETPRDSNPIVSQLDLRRVKPENLFPPLPPPKTPRPPKELEDKLRQMTEEEEEEEEDIIGINLDESRMPPPTFENLDESRMQEPSIEDLFIKDPYASKFEGAEEINAEVEENLQQTQYIRETFDTIKNRIQTLSSVEKIETEADNIDKTLKNLENKTEDIIKTIKEELKNKNINKVRKTQLTKVIEEEEMKKEQIKREREEFNKMIEIEREEKKKREEEEKQKLEEEKQKLEEEKQKLEEEKQKELKKIEEERKAKEEENKRYREEMLRQAKLEEEEKQRKAEEAEKEFENELLKKSFEVYSTYMNAKSILNMASKNIYNAPTENDLVKAFKNKGYTKDLRGFTAIATDLIKGAERIIEDIKQRGLRVSPDSIKPVFDKFNNYINKYELESVIDNYIGVRETFELPAIQEKGKEREEEEEEGEEFTVKDITTLINPKKSNILKQKINKNFDENYKKMYNNAMEFYKLSIKDNVATIDNLVNYLLVKQNKTSYRTGTLNNLSSLLDKSAKYQNNLERGLNEKLNEEEKENLVTERNDLYKKLSDKKLGLNRYKDYIPNFQIIK